MKLRRRHLLTGLPLLALAEGALAQPRTDMAKSGPREERGEVQVGAGTQAGVTTGSSGPQKKSKPGAEKDRKNDPAETPRTGEAAADKPAKERR